jgi:hypothetical protein
MVAKRILINDIRKHMGEIHTALEIKQMFGYSPNTYIWDTTLFQRKWLKWIPDKNNEFKTPYKYEIVEGEQI